MSSFLEFMRQNRGTNIFGEGTVSDEDRMDLARSQGFTEFDGGRAYRGVEAGRASYKEGRRLSSFRPEQADPMADQMELLLQGLMRDTGEYQRTADEQFGRNNQQIQALSGFTSSAPASINAQAAALAQLLQGQAGQVGALGDQQHGEFQDFTGGIMEGLTADLTPIQESLGDLYDDGIELQGMLMDLSENAAKVGDPADVEAMVREGLSKADAAASKFERNIDEFEDRTAQDASITANAIRRSAKNREMQIKAGVRADGRPMSPAEQDAAMAMLSGQVDEQVQTASTQIFSQFNRDKAQLHQALAGIEMQAANFRMVGADILNKANQVELQGLGLSLDALKSVGQNRAQLLDIKNLEQRMAFDKAQIHLGLSSQFLQSQAGQRQMAELASGLVQSSAQIQQSAILQAASLEFQGLTATAQLVQQNPESVVSYFQGLLGLFSARAAITGDTGASGGGYFGGGGGGSSDEEESQDEGPSQDELNRARERRNRNRAIQERARADQRERNRRSASGYNWSQRRGDGRRNAIDEIQFRSGKDY